MRGSASPAALWFVIDSAFPLVPQRRIEQFAAAVSIFNGIILSISASNEVNQRFNLKDRRGIRNSKHLSGNLIL